MGSHLFTHPKLIPMNKATTVKKTASKGACVILSAIAPNQRCMYDKTTTPYACFSPWCAHCNIVSDDVRVAETVDNGIQFSQAICSQAKELENNEI